MRRKTREVWVGKVGVGGNHPIRIQSMTTSNTRDVEATVGQIMRLSDAGCEIARITVQGKKEAEAAETIKNTLISKGYEIPLVADIHFYPPAAMMVVDFVDKVRINPGNYVDRRAVFKTIEYTDESYKAELQKIEEGFAPLVEKCKRLKKAMRIGTNHGSLSDRIMNRFGDTPLGMVESALEFTKVCQKYDFHDLIFSMKASNPLVMIEAYRQLVKKLDELGWNYPLHLGVTEAGDGEDGRVKSAVGIGSLLLEGLGDTIRVSLTEDPWEEIDPCKRLISLSPMGKRCKPQPLSRSGKVFLTVCEADLLHENFYTAIGCQIELNRPKKQQNSVDAILLKENPLHPVALNKLDHLKEAGIDVVFEGTLPTIRVEQEEHFEPTSQILFFEGYELSPEDYVIHSAAKLGALLADGIGEGICLGGNPPLARRRELAFSILAAARIRFSKTDYIACPGCGRTLFNLQEVTKRIRSKTSHLPGVKIAIMGCIVNGPGEMADADFGYVGSKTGKIDLYVGKTCVEKNIDESIADEKLIDLIKIHGRWINN